jgi:transposase
MSNREQLSEFSKEVLIDLLINASCDASSLKEERDDYRDKLNRANVERDKLRAIIAKLQRHQFGRRSERLTSDQLQLALDDLAQTLAAIDAETEAEADKACETDEQKQARKARAPRNNNRGALPDHLPREHHFIEPEEKVCPCCNGPLHVIGDVETEQLDKEPAKVKVLVTHRPKYGCRACEGAVVQAPAPERPIPGGIPTEGLLASIAIDKYCDNLPLYRQAKRFEREGIHLDRQTLCNWVGKVCFLVQPIYDHILADILASPVIFGDETTVPVLEPGSGKTKTGYFWVYARDERSWRGGRPPAVAYIYEEDRRHHHAVDHLARFQGILHCDGYGAYDRGLKARLVDPDTGIQLAGCNVHARRNFYDVHEATRSPIAAEALRRYAALYAIEDEIRDCPPQTRQQVRQERSLPLMNDFEDWLRQQLPLISGRSELAKAIRYHLTRSQSLRLFITDGRVEMDTNTVERAIRPQKLTVKNALFAGSDGGARHWAIMATLIETAKMCAVEPFAYLRDSLIRITNGHTINRIGELAPWHYRPARAGDTVNADHPKTSRPDPHSGAILAPMPTERNVLAG